MSAQRSNRTVLVEGALRCLERLPPERITSRAIAKEAGANPASIVYHFGSKDDLVAEAAILGLDRWLEYILDRLDRLAADEPRARLAAVAREVAGTQDSRRSVMVNYVLALARATHDPRVRRRLVAGYERTRPAVISLLGLEHDQSGHDAAALMLAMFHGLMIQALLDRDLAIPGDRITMALGRMRELLPSTVL